MLLDFTRSILSLLVYSVDLVYGDVPGTVNGLLTSVRQPGKYLLESRDDVVLDDLCNGIRTHTMRTLKVFVSRPLGQTL